MSSLKVAGVTRNIFQTDLVQINFFGSTIICWISLLLKVCFMFYTKGFQNIFQLNFYSFVAEVWSRCWFDIMATTSNMRKPPFASAETLFRSFFASLPSFFQVFTLFHSMTYLSIILFKNDLKNLLTISELNQPAFLWRGWNHQEH